MSTPRNQIRLHAITGSLADISNDRQEITPVPASSINASSLQDILKQTAESIRRIHGADSFTEAQAGVFTHGMTRLTGDMALTGSITVAGSAAELIDKKDGGSLKIRAGDLSSGIGSVYVELSGSELNLSDGHMSTAGMASPVALAESSTDWSRYKSIFGEVSLVSAISTAAALPTDAKFMFKVASETSSLTGAQLQQVDGTHFSGTFVAAPVEARNENVNVFLNGQLLVSKSYNATDYDYDIAGNGSSISFAFNLQPDDFVTVRVPITVASVAEYVAGNGGSPGGGGGGGGASTLVELTDVAEVSLESGDVLVYDGSNWANKSQKPDPVIYLGNGNSQWTSDIVITNTTVYGAWDHYSYIDFYVDGTLGLGKTITFTPTTGNWTDPGVTTVEIYDTTTWNIVHTFNIGSSSSPVSYTINTPVGVPSPSAKYDVYVYNAGANRGSLEMTITLTGFDSLYEKSHKLNTLGDVQVVSASYNDVLAYDGENFVNVPGISTFANVYNPQNGQALVYYNGGWTNAGPDISYLGGTYINNPVQGQVLSYTSNGWSNVGSDSVASNNTKAYIMRTYTSLNSTATLKIGDSEIYSGATLENQIPMGNNETALFEALIVGRPEGSGFNANHTIAYKLEFLAYKNQPGQVGIIGTPIKTVINETTDTAGADVNVGVYFDTATWTNQTIKIDVTGPSAALQSTTYWTGYVRKIRAFAG